jgi:protoporphyrinogen oxidase
LFPKTKTGVIAEITCNASDPLFKAADKEIFDKAITDLQSAGLLTKENVAECFTIRIRDIYPIYSLDYKQNLQTVLDYLDSFSNVYSLGRLGLFNYNNSDHCIDMSKKAARHIHNKASKKQWRQLIKYFDSYRIVD